jgi:hypothetical protein
MLTAPLYSTSVDDKAIIDYFLLDQQMGLDPKLRTYSGGGLVIYVIANPI